MYSFITFFKNYSEDGNKLVDISKTEGTLAKYDRGYRRLGEFMKAKYKITDIALKENMFVNCTIHLKRVGRGFLTDQKIQKIMDNEFDSNRLE